MPDIRLNIHTQDGRNQSVEAPPDMGTADFLKDIIDGFELATQDAEGNRINWRIHDKDIGAELDPDQSLETNGVRHEHHLYLQRQVVAGAARRVRKS
jgi:hypothetical protein